MSSNHSALSPQSSSLPMLPGAEPFLYEAGEVGCLLVHGFTSTPFEMRGLGRYLAAHGITASALLLPGHGTRPGDLQGTTWHDWYASVNTALDDMLSRCTRVYLAGLSLGGALSLYTAAQRRDDIAGLVAISSPIFLPPGLGYVLKRMEPRLPYIHKHFRDIQDPVARARHVSYMKAPLGAIASLAEFLGPVRASLPQINTPALVVCARRDHVVPPATARYIYRRLSSPDKRLLVLQRGFHVATVDTDRQKLYSSTYNFIKKREA